MDLSALAEKWREEASGYERDGAQVDGAKLLRRVAGELEANAAAERLETVTLEEAEAIGGYSYSHLQHLVADGTLPNAGRPGAPRLYCRDVPRKPGHGVERVAPASPLREWFDDAVRTA